MQLGFIGSGNMAVALARGWGDPVLATDNGSGAAQRLVDELGGEAVSNRECAERADVLILAHKPYQLDLVASEVDARGFVVSILGATTVEQIKQAHPNAGAVIRVEPNPPAALRRGVTVFATTDDPHAEAIQDLFARLGTVIELPERLIGVAGAVSG